MVYRKLGNTGLPVSILSFGAWVTFGNQADTTEVKELLTTAYNAGVNFFDNAEGYNFGVAETMMGKAIKELQWPRDSFIVSSKVFLGIRENPLPTQWGLHRKHLVEGCNQALQRLQVEYLDLYFCHRPDPTTPTEEIVETMTNLVRQGKILYWGTSEWTASQIMNAHGLARERNLVPPVMEQAQYNILHRSRVEEEYAVLYKELAYGVTAWSPLASGLLTGKYNDGIPENSRVNLPGYEWLKELLMEKYWPARVNGIKKLSAVAESLGISLTRLAIAWCLKNKNVATVILGASKIEQLKENLKALEDIELLDKRVMGKIATILSKTPNTLRHGNEG